MRCHIEQPAKRSQRSLAPKGYCNRAIRNIIAMLTLSLSFPAVSFALGIPITQMSPFKVGIEYNGTIAGQTITRATVSSVQKSHYFIVRYAPLPYILVSAGAGATRFTTKEYNATRFSGTSGASGMIGIHGFSPRLTDFLMITAGTHIGLLNSTQDGYRYTAAVADPGIGIIVLIDNLLDIEAGAKGHLLYGQMEAPSINEPAIFSNNNFVRGYLSLSLHAPNGDGYVTLDVDVSPDAKSDWSDGPQETSISISIGTLIRPFKKKTSPDTDKKRNSVSEDHNSMNQQLEKMTKELE